MLIVIDLANTAVAGMGHQHCGRLNCPLHAATVTSSCVRYPWAGLSGLYFLTPDANLLNQTGGVPSTASINLYIRILLINQCGDR